MLKTRYSLILIIFAGIFLLGACQANTPTPAVENTPPPAPTEEPQENSLTPAVSVSDQEIDGSNVTIAEVISSGPGWLVIHAQADGKPGPILGYSPVEDGTNSDVTVEIDLAQATETIYAMLHTDAGEVGTFEFPDGPDGPVSVDGSVVTPAFQISGLSEITPAVSVSDQEIDGSSVTIAEVVSSGPGWLVIHAQADGKPGPILGYSPVEDGTNPDVTVEIDLAQATETIYAMLHTDAGEAGTFEFPDGPDGPVSVDGSVVTPAFQISGLAQESTFTLSTAEDPELGPYLTDGEGMSLYLFTNDEPGTSNCYDNCAVNWPPLLLEGDLSLGEGLDENLVGTTERNGGSLQVTYNEWPLYYFIQDSSPGDIKGQGVGEVWYLISPEGSEIVPVDY